MKQRTTLVFVILMALTVITMFLPLCSFHDNSAAALDADIAKQQGRVESAQAKYDRDEKAGKYENDADARAKQQAKIDKEQAKVDALLAEKEAAASNADADGISYSLLPGKLPAELEIDMQIVNQNSGIYPTDFTAMYVARWVAAALLLLSAALVLAARGKIVSKLYTYASFANLIAILLLAYCILRVQALPVKLPYSNPVMNPWTVALMLVLPAVGLLLNCSSLVNTKRSMIYVLCITLCALSILPFWIMIVNATRNSQQIQGGMTLIPSTFLWRNWQVLEDKNFNILIGFKNSAIIAFGSTILSVYFSALTAYGFTVYKFKGAKFLYAVVMAIIMIPGQVTGTGFYMFMYRLGWTNSYLPLIIPAIAAASTVFFFRQYLAANLQISLVEAARIDGAGEFYTYNTIIMPIMVPAMATMGIMAVIGSWNNYLTPLMLLSDPKMKTLPMMVKELRGDIYRTEFGSIYLGLTMTALPLLIVYFCFSKYIIAGVAVGGVKE